MADAATIRPTLNPIPDPVRTLPTPGEAIKLLGERIDKLAVVMNHLQDVSAQLVELRLKLDGKKEGEFVEAKTQDITIPVPVGALISAKQAEVSRTEQDFEQSCTAIHQSLKDIYVATNLPKEPSNGNGKTGSVDMDALSRALGPQQRTPPPARDH